MRLYAVTAGVLTAAVFAVAGGPTASAQTLNNQKQQTIVEVQPGDYLEKIAEAQNTTYRRLYDANLEIKHPDLIYPGNKIRVPSPDEQLAQRPLPQDTAVAPEAPAPKALPKTAAPKSSNTVRSTSAGVPAVASGSVWDRLAQCEAGGNWAINTGNGFFGGLQFTLSSWRAAGGSGYPNQASREEQIARGQVLLSKQGWGAWPACSKKLGLR